MSAPLEASAAELISGDLLDRIAERMGEDLVDLLAIRLAERLDPDRSLSEAEAAQFLNCAPATLARKRVAGGGPMYLDQRANTGKTKKGGNGIKYTRRHLIEYQEACRRSSTSDPGPDQ